MVSELITLCDVEEVLPPLSLDEYNGLRESIKAEGILTPLIIWNNTIIDGHHRYKIAKELDIPFQTVEKPFDSLDEAKMWIIQNQGSRRNINAYMRVVYALRLKEKIAEKYRAWEYAGMKKDPCPNSGKGSGSTDKEIAKIANVAHSTVARVTFLENNADEETKKKLRDGEMTINRAYTEARAEEQSKALAAASMVSEGEETALEKDETFQTCGNDPFFVDPEINFDEIKRGKEKKRNPCVTLKMINRVDPRSLVNVLFSMFDKDYRHKLVEMLVDEMMKSDGSEDTISLVNRIDKKIQ